MSENCVSDHMWRAALLSIPYLVGEKLDSMIKTDEVAVYFSKLIVYQRGA